MNLWPFRKKEVEVLPQEFIKVTRPHWRPDTEIVKQEVNFVFNGAGMGDYIYWSTAVEWAIATHVHLYGAIFAPNYFHPIVKHWFRKYEDRFKCLPISEIKENKRYFNGRHNYICPRNDTMINSTGFNLLDIGFHYYANIDYVPEGWAKMPEINGDECDVSRFELPEKFAVVTTEATSPIRKLKGETINDICRYLVGKGITPVFLGKKEITKDYSAKSPENLDLSGVLDLREKTGIIEAAVILSKAKVVVGLDNGLLHLACCSFVPVVFGFNTVDPRHRKPFRREGAKTLAVYPGESLHCRFCQSHIRYALGHNFHNCLYGDKACLEHLNAGLFVQALEKLGI